MTVTYRVQEGTGPWPKDIAKKSGNRYYRKDVDGISPIDLDGFPVGTIIEITFPDGAEIPEWATR